MSCNNNHVLSASELIKCTNEYSTVFVEEKYDEVFYRAGIFSLTENEKKAFRNNCKHSN